MKFYLVYAHSPRSKGADLYVTSLFPFSYDSSSDIALGFDTLDKAKEALGSVPVSVTSYNEDVKIMKGQLVLHTRPLGIDA